MTELIEGVLVGMVTADIEAQCPFAPVPAQGASQKQDEDILKDDLEAATDQQENDGGELGRNLINGSHNGVWLPGNYYIRKTTSPIKGKSWSDLGNHPWCLNYVAAVTKGAGGQMHDAHTKYSEAVLGLLNTMADLLLAHACEACEPQDINPPFMIKQRLYGISARLREQLTAVPAAWKRPWYASDRWRDDAFVGDQPSPAFMVAYNHAELEDPEP